MLTQIGLTPAQRTQVLDCYEVYQERKAARGAEQESLVQVGGLAVVKLSLLALFFDIALH